MTQQEITKALETGYNKQGRTLSMSMRVKYLAALSPTPRNLIDMEYRSMQIGGVVGRYSVRENTSLWPRSFTSMASARAAIDACYAIRAEVA